MVVVLKVLAKPFIEFWHALVVVEVDVLILHTAPQPFYEYVVQCTTSTIHADEDLSIQQHLCELFAGELTPLVGIEYNWLSTCQ